MEIPLKKSLIWLYMVGIGINSFPIIRDHHVHLRHFRAVFEYFLMDLNPWFTFFPADVEFPTDDDALDEDAENMIRALLRKDPNTRLGAGGKFSNLDVVDCFKGTMSRRFSIAIEIIIGPTIQWTYTMGHVPNYLRLIFKIFSIIKVP